MFWTCKETPPEVVSCMHPKLMLVCNCVIGDAYLSLVFVVNKWERSGSVVECLTRDRGAAGSSLIGVTALWSFWQGTFNLA